MGMLINAIRHLKQKRLRVVLMLIAVTLSTTLFTGTTYATTILDTTIQLQASGYTTADIQINTGLDVPSFNRTHLQTLIADIPDAQLASRYVVSAQYNLTGTPFTSPLVGCIL